VAHAGEAVNATVGQSLSEVVSVGRRRGLVANGFDDAYRCLDLSRQRHPIWSSPRDAASLVRFPRGTPTRLIGAIMLDLDWVSHVPT